MRFAYADPPYPGQAKRRYQCEEVDHQILINRLYDEYPDGWALSTDTRNLHLLLPMCKEYRLGAWVKPFAVFRPNVNPAYAWEPVIFYGGRRGDRTRKTVRDWVSANITLRKGLCGAKPEAFCNWILDLLGWLPDDQLDDLFPGTGVMGRVVEQRKIAATV